MVTFTGDVTIAGKAGDKDVELKGKVRTLTLESSSPDDYTPIGAKWSLDKFWRDENKYSAIIEFDGPYSIVHEEPKKFEIERRARIKVADRRLIDIGEARDKVGAPPEARLEIVPAALPPSKKEIVVRGGREVYLEFTWTEKA